MPARVLLRWAILGPFLLVLAAGCGDPQGKQAVSGSVTFQGKPLDQGSITFIPTTEDVPTQSGTLIKNGEYQIPSDKGLAPGTYRVSISSGDGKTPDPASDALPGPSGNFSSVNRIPAEFNTNSTKEITVKKGGTNKFDFIIP